MERMVFLIIFLLNISLYLYSSNQILFKKDETKKIPDVAAAKVISLYSSNEIFPFEDNARKACNDKLNTFRKYQIDIIGCNIIAKDNDYTYTIEYLSQLKNPSSIPSVLIDKYHSSINYWNENLARNELNFSLSNLKNTPVKIIDSSIIDNGQEYGFVIKYAVDNVVKKSKNYYVFIDKTDYGKYTFQSQAESDIQRVISLFNQNNIPVLQATAKEKDNEYTIEVEFFNKSDNPSSFVRNPLYSIETYKCDEEFNFQNNAIDEAKKRNSVFVKAGLFPISNYAVESENNWFFLTDYIVKNIYKNGVVIGKEFMIRRYNNPINFDFESDAIKAMNEKAGNFNSSGFYVISSKTYETGDNKYSFYIDYIEKKSY